ncbi:MAG: HEPN domain-containing protein [Microscillaceae bacterium]|nr:HEPN domain-containing protein [Microscillaceae bacterium]
MNEEDRGKIVQYRIEKAQTTWQEANLGAENSLWNLCANRLYYAAFYAVTALLLKNGHKTQTHKGVRTLFAQHFIKTEMLSIDLNDLYNELFDKRQAGDYADFTDYTQEDIEPLIRPTEAFIHQIKQFIDLEATY